MGVYTAAVTFCRMRGGMSYDVQATTRSRLNGIETLGAIQSWAPNATPDDGVGTHTETTTINRDLVSAVQWRGRVVYNGGSSTWGYTSWVTVPAP